MSKQDAGWIVLMIPPMLKLSRCCVSIMSLSLAGGYKVDCLIDTLTRCSSLSCVISYTPPQSQIRSVFLRRAAGVRSITYLLEASLAPQEGPFWVHHWLIRHTFVSYRPVRPAAWSTTLPLGPLLVFYLFLISARPADSSLFIHECGMATDSQFVLHRFLL